MEKGTTMRRTAYGIRLTAACATTILVVALAGCGGGAGAGAGTAGGEPRSSSPSAHDPPTDAVRTVRVFDREPAPSPSPTELRAGLEEGALPAGTLEARVLTDEDCAPDSQGISHCRNQVRLADGSTVVLRHPHDMTRVPCLVPGERVLLLRA